MIKIAYLISTLQKTGPTNILVGTINHLDKTRYEPVVITLSPESQTSDSWTPHLKRQGVQIFPLNLKRYQLLQLPLKLKQTIATIQPDIIHSHCFRSTILSAFVLKNFKRIATIHCDYTQDFPMAYGTLIGTWMEKLFSCALKHMDKRICCSHALATLLQQKFPPLAFDYVNNGIDTVIFHPVTDKNTLRKELGLPLNKVIFIWVGSFIHCKNPLCLVDAIKKIKVQNAFFVFCGARGPLLETAKQQLQNCKNVLFTGYTNKVARYLQASDCYISTSLSEGFHLSVYEALACGLPVILSDLDIYDEIKPTGCSFVFSPAKSEELQTKILDFLAHSDTEFSDRAVTFIKQGFSTETMSLKYEEHYKELLVI